MHRERHIETLGRLINRIELRQSQAAHGTHHTRQHSGHHAEVAHGALQFIGCFAGIMRRKQCDALKARAHAQKIMRSEEHTSELQSLAYLVCRLLLEKKKKKKKKHTSRIQT